MTRVSPGVSRLEIILRADLAGNVPTVFVNKSLVARADSVFEIMDFFAAAGVANRAISNDDD